MCSVPAKKDVPRTGANVVEQICNALVFAGAMPAQTVLWRIGMELKVTVMMVFLTHQTGTKVILTMKIEHICPFGFHSLLPFCLYV